MKKEQKYLIAILIVGLILGSVIYQLYTQNKDLKGEISDLGNVEPIVCECEDKLTQYQIDQIEVNKTQGITNATGVQSIVKFINDSINQPVE